MSERLNGNCFVLTRPEAPGDQTVTVLKMSEYKSENANKILYTRSFENFFLNLEDRLPEVMHRQCLATILPTMALLIHYELRDAANFIREGFLAQATEGEKEEYENFPDQESSLHYALSYLLRKFKQTVSDFSPNQAIQENPDLFKVLQRVYFDLPVVFISTLIDMATP